MQKFAARPQERLAAAPTDPAAPRRQTQILQRLGLIDDPAESSDDYPGGSAFTGPVIRTALCVEPRNGRLHVFMPPVGTLEDYLDLVASIEDTADRLQLPVILEGYLPPNDPRIQVLKVTPDPGVIEVNVQPASSWEQLKQNHLRTLRRRPTLPAWYRKIPARWTPHRHRWRKSPCPRSCHTCRQPVPPTPRSASIHHWVLE
jgi:uncharacterized protein (DUF2126 family)